MSPNTIDYESQGMGTRTYRTRNTAILVFCGANAFIGAASALIVGSGSPNWSRVLLLTCIGAAIGILSGWMWATVLLKLVRRGNPKGIAASLLGITIGACALAVPATISLAMDGDSDMASLANVVVPVFSAVIGGFLGLAAGGFCAWILPEQLIRRESKQ